MARRLTSASSISLLTVPGGARVGSVAPPPASRVCAASLSSRSRRRRLGVAVAMVGGEKEEEPTASSVVAGRMDLNEYMVAVDRPLGLRFALAVDGRVFVHSLKRGGNAEKSRIIMVGDTLKKAGNEQNEVLVNIKDLGDTVYGSSKVSIAERRVFL